MCARPCVLSFFFFALLRICYERQLLLVVGFERDLTLARFISELFGCPDSAYSGNISIFKVLNLRAIGLNVFFFRSPFILLCLFSWTGYIHTQTTYTQTYQKYCSICVKKIYFNATKLKQTETKCPKQHNFSV